MVDRISEKDEHEKEEEEVERLLDESPDKKPPRDDKSRDYIDTGDPDVDEDPDVDDDPDMSMNYKDIGGSVAQRWASEHPHPPQTPDPVVPEPFDLTTDELADIVVAADEWYGKPFIEDLRADKPDVARKVAVEYGVYTAQGRRFYRAVDASTFEMLVDALERFQS